ncbi:site-specific integrase [Bacillaceae bacterium Marseille-Q3522]|nr:site-specific integrase [Bacillaceae bacterium Marseille-Q3522]
MPIYYDKKYKNYYFITRVQLKNGQAKQVKRRGFTSSKEARLAESQFIINWENEVIADEEYTLKEVAEEYLEWYKRRRKESSYTKIASIVNTHLITAFGSKKISSIRNRDITKFHDHLIDNFSAAHAKKIHTTLSAIFNFAIKQEYVKKNPARLVGNVDMEDKKHMEYWTLEEFKQFIAIIDDLPYKTLFMTLYYSGLRKGELLALIWADIDFNRNTISVSKTVYNRKVTSPKTKASNRTVLMPKHTMQLLARLKVSADHYKSNYVVFGEFYDHVSTTTLDRRFAHYVKKAEVKKIRIHDFRHSHASYLINKGYTPTMIAKRLGHGDVATLLNIYGHLYPSTEKEAVSKMEDDF